MNKDEYNIMRTKDFNLQW